MLTANEKKILRYLLVHFDSDTSINKIAKECGISPGGAHKIFKKFEKEDVLSQKKIANIVSFKINFEHFKSQKVLELALIDPLEGRIKYRLEDLSSLRDIVDICVIFGSYAQNKSNPKDLDLLVVFDKSNFKKYKDKLKKIKEIIPIKVHDLVQTKEDLISNLKEGDKVLKEAIEKGIVLWGQEKLIEVFAHVS